MTEIASQGTAIPVAQGKVSPFPSLLPPLPRGFKPVRGSDVSGVRVLQYGDHPVTRRRPRGSTPAQKSGLRYQRSVCDHLREVFPRRESLLVGPWLEYSMGLRRGYCQPDALGFFYDLVYIFEIKLSSTTDAWWQLRHLYEPVCRVLYPAKRLVLVNVVKSYSPEVLFPESRWPLLFNITRLREQAGEAFSVQWRPGD